jgi:AraC-like DNA-binding protein
MEDAYAFHEGAFGRAIVLETRQSLVAHSHSESQLALWLGGARAAARIGSEVVAYSEDTALGSNAFELHDMTLLDDGPCVFLLFMVSSDWLEERRRATGRPFMFLSPRVSIDARLRQVCWRVLDLIITKAVSSQAVDDEVEELLTAAVGASMAPPAPPRPRALGPALDHRLRAAIKYMREHVSEKITLDEIAAGVGLSRAHFFTLFRDQLNTTPQVFWSAVRVEEAMRRMVQDEVPVTSLALDLGFSAPGNFSRFFKEITGTSPTVFKRAARLQAPTTLTGQYR